MWGMPSTSHSEYALSTSRDPRDELILRLRAELRSVYRREKEEQSHLVRNSVSRALDMFQAGSCIKLSVAELLKRCAWEAFLREVQDARQKRMLKSMHSCQEPEEPPRPPKCRKEGRQDTLLIKSFTIWQLGTISEKRSRIRASPNELAASTAIKCQAILQGCIRKSDHNHLLDWIFRIWYFAHFCFSRSVKLCGTMSWILQGRKSDHNHLIARIFRTWYFAHVCFSRSVKLCGTMSWILQGRKSDHNHLLAWIFRTWYFAHVCFSRSVKLCGTMSWILQGRKSDHYHFLAWIFRTWYFAHVCFSRSVKLCGTMSWILQGRKSDHNHLLAWIFRAWYFAHVRFSRSVKLCGTMSWILQGVCTNIAVLVLSSWRRSSRVRKAVNGLVNLRTPRITQQVMACWRDYLKRDRHGSAVVVVLGRRFQYYLLKQVFAMWQVTTSLASMSVSGALVRPRDTSWREFAKKSFEYHCRKRSSLSCMLLLFGVFSSWGRVTAATQYGCALILFDVFYSWARVTAVSQYGKSVEATARTMQVLLTDILLSKSRSRILYLRMWAAWSKHVDKARSVAKIDAAFTHVNERAAKTCILAAWSILGKATRWTAGATPQQYASTVDFRMHAFLLRVLYCWSRICNSAPRSQLVDDRMLCSSTSFANWCRVVEGIWERCQLLCSPEADDSLSVRRGCDQQQQQPFGASQSNCSETDSIQTVWDPGDSLLQNHPLAQSDISLQPQCDLIYPVSYVVVMDQGFSVGHSNLTLSPEPSRSKTGQDPYTCSPGTPQSYVDCTLWSPQGRENTNLHQSSTFHDEQRSPGTPQFSVDGTRWSSQFREETDFDQLSFVHGVQYRCNLTFDASFPDLTPGKSDMGCVEQEQRQQQPAEDDLRLTHFPAIAGHGHVISSGLASSIRNSSISGWGNLSQVGAPSLSGSLSCSSLSYQPTPREFLATCKS